MPLTIIEAMLCGKAVVASDNRGHRELVQEGINGFLASPDDWHAFADKICTLLKCPPSAPERIAETVSRYSDRSVTEELRRIYELPEK